MTQQTYLEPVGSPTQRTGWTGWITFAAVTIEVLVIWALTAHGHEMRTQ